MPAFPPLAVPHRPQPRAGSSAALRGAHEASRWTRCATAPPTRRPIRRRHRAPPGGAVGGVALRRPGAGAAQLRHPQGRAGPFAGGDRRAAGAERAGGKGGSASRAGAACASWRRSRGPRRPLPASSPAVARYVGPVQLRATGTAYAPCWRRMCSLTWCRAPQRQGSAVGNYLSNYDLRHDWRLAPAWLEGREGDRGVPRAGRRAARLLHRAGRGGRQGPLHPRFPPTCPTSCGNAPDRGSPLPLLEEGCCSPAARPRRILAPFVFVQRIQLQYFPWGADAPWGRSRCHD